MKFPYSYYLHIIQKVTIILGTVWDFQMVVLGYDGRLHSYERLGQNYAFNFERTVLILQMNKLQLCGIYCLIEEIIKA